MTFPCYPEYKYSGVEWIGDIPAHWRIEPLKRSCSVFPSNVDKKSYEGQTPVRLCNYTDVYYNENILADMDFMPATATAEQIEKFRLRAGDVIFTKDSETADDIAIAAYVPHDIPGVICGYHLSMIRPGKGVDGSFIKRFFDSASAKAYFAVSANGLTRVGLSQYATDNVPTPLPELSEQTQIARFLDHETARIDALIEEQQRLIELLKEKRQAMISHAVTKGLDPSVPMKDSGVEWLGEVPAHWQVLAIKRFFRMVADPAPENNDFELLSVYTEIGVRPRKELEQKGNKASTTDGYWRVKKGDIVVNKLLAWMGAVGYSDYDGVTSPAYDILRPSRKLSPKFYHYIFRGKPAQQEFKRWSRGIMEMRLRLYFDELGRILMPFPPLEEQEKIVAFIEAMETKFEALSQEASEQVRLLSERRSALISAAVTGKIDLRDWQPPAGTPAPIREEETA
jgi:type I restriction enzyme S subunit